MGQSGEQGGQGLVGQFGGPDVQLLNAGFLPVQGLDGLVVQFWKIFGEKLKNPNITTCVGQQQSGEMTTPLQDQTKAGTCGGGGGEQDEAKEVIRGDPDQG